MLPFPARYAPNTQPPTSLLTRLLQHAPDMEARLRILDAVDWNTPEVYTSSSWSPFPGRTQRELKKLHPLSAIAKIGNNELFARAIDMAHKKGVEGLVVQDDSSKGVQLDDWVASGVLDTVTAFGTPHMMSQLIGKITERTERTTLLKTFHLDSRDAISDPLASLASRNGSWRDEEDYRRMIAKIEDFYNLSLYVSLYDLPLHASDPWPKVQKASKGGSLGCQVKARVRSHALLVAARNGNAPMLQAVLSLSNVEINHSHVVAAIDSGGLDLALELLVRSPVPGESKNLRLHSKSREEALAGWMEPNKEDSAQGTVAKTWGQSIWRKCSAACPQAWRSGWPWIPRKRLLSSGNTSLKPATRCCGS